MGDKIIHSNLPTMERKQQMIFAGLALALPFLLLAEIAESNEEQRKEDNGEEVITVEQDSHVLQEKEDVVLKTLEQLQQDMQALANELNSAQAEAERAEYEAHQQRIKNRD